MSWSALVLEVEQFGGGWVERGRVHPDDRPGSMTDHGPRGREVLLLRRFGDRSEISRSRAGADDLSDDAMTRVVVVTAGEELLATLRDGDVWIRAFRAEPTSDPVRVRFRHVDDGRPN